MAIGGVDEGAKVHEGNPHVLRLSFTSAPPTLAIAEVDKGYPRPSTLAPSSTSAIARVGGRGEGAEVDKGAQVHKGAKVHKGNPHLTTLAPKRTSTLAPEAAEEGKI